MVNGEYFLSGSQVRIVDIIAPNLETVTSMFEVCPLLVELKGDFGTKLKSIDNMCYDCSVLQSFNINLEHIEEAGYAFNGCRSLQNFTVNLSSLKNAEDMFSGCTSLNNFSSDLSSLESGIGMFGSSSRNCAKLNSMSVENIALTINNLAEKGETGEITLGIAKGMQGYTGLINALETIRNKGWIVEEIYA